ncbi:DUF6338 family protein [Modestobacter sp. VKM Ac-2978]|uniref:DUF6338 family protein n=1 Tax=Modestobacter sp. VKM Ac-2978 TaxID=3004132 RepID=UPI0022AB23AC|nr:DUF6338 family protein [Modestobacter sp. VKM Ac-2978]MCZ2847738.1 DUF6338 family protein [Modestobacter sp. VKM Ac-2978]
MNTFQALAVSILAVLPGASYTFAYERLAGAYGVSLADRLIRFLAASAIFHAFLIGPELQLYRVWIDSGRLGRGEVNAWQLEGVAVVYVVLPTLVGSLVGYGRKKRWRWVRVLTGSSPEPRAWDHVWTQPERTSVVRLKLKSGPWLAGFFGNVEGAPQSYAAGYPEAADLFLSLQVQVDRDTGEFITDDNGSFQPVEGRSSLLIRWEEVEYADIVEV